jgi:hypothetical protein
MATHKSGQLSIAFLAFTLILLGLPADPAEGGPTQTNPISYVYDELERLRAAVDPPAGAALYRYDAVDNMLSKTGRTS